jgi:hypothetical protein
MLGGSDPGKERLRERGSGTGSGPDSGHRPMLMRSGPRVSSRARRREVRVAAARPAGGAGRDQRPTVSPAVRGGTGRRCGWSCTDGGGG